MSKPAFATYVHHEIGLTTRPAQEIQWFGHSYPYFMSVYKALADCLNGFPVLPLRREPIGTFSMVHSEQYVEALKQMAKGCKPEVTPKLSLECSGFEFCLPGYEYTLGGLVEAIDRMSAGTLDRAYCVGLPGHHAHREWGHGYCMLNAQAAAARYAQSRGFKRVLIIDWDIHHGDGTQDIFAHDPSVFCISLHSGLDLYMMKASKLEAGTVPGGNAVGHCNIPLVHSLFSDTWLAQKFPTFGPAYRAVQSLPACEEALDKLPWSPDLLCLCSGYDSHKEDCGDQITDWVDADFETLTRLALGVAKRANCPVLSVHCGGYKLAVAVRAAQAHVRVLAGDH